LEEDGIVLREPAPHLAFQGLKSLRILILEPVEHRSKPSTIPSQFLVLLDLGRGDDSILVEGERTELCQFRFNNNILVMRNRGSISFAMFSLKATGGRRPLQDCNHGLSGKLPIGCDLDLSIAPGTCNAWVGKLRRLAPGNLLPDWVPQKSQGLQ